MDPEWVQAATCQAAAVGDGNDGAEGVADVHCSWNQAATATGRLSSNAPNLQVQGRNSPMLLAFIGTRLPGALLAAGQPTTAFVILPKRSAAVTC